MQCVYMCVGAVPFYYQRGRWPVVAFDLLFFFVFFFVDSLRFPFFSLWVGLGYDGFHWVKMG